MSDTAIAAENLSKRYLIGGAVQRHETLAGSFAAALTAPIRNLRNLSRLDAGRIDGDASDVLLALDDVSFGVRRGEVLGIIGRNGAGKSTLLKILSRITEPTSGWVGIKGRVSSLLEVGTGFHPELTGRDNVYMNGTLLGMTKREIDRKFDEIVAFSGVERFLDTPVKRYSSGMSVRLAFSVAAHLDPDILIVDEVLAVGDYDFQQRCLGKIQEVARGGEGRTVLFVSHNMGMIRTLCQRAIVLQGGTIRFDGPPEGGITAYEDQFRSSRCDHRIELGEDPELPIQILEAAVIDSNGQPAGAFDLFEPASVLVRYWVRKPLRGVNVCMNLRYRGVPLLGTFDTDESPELFEGRRIGHHEARIRLPMEIMKAGSYAVNLSCGRTNTGSAFQALQDALRFEVRESMDLSLKSFSMNRPFQVLTRIEWATRMADPVAAS